MGIGFRVCRDSLNVLAFALFSLHICFDFCVCFSRLFKNTPPEQLCHCTPYLIIFVVKSFFNFLPLALALGSGIHGQTVTHNISMCALEIIILPAVAPVYDLLRELRRAYRNIKAKKDTKKNRKKKRYSIGHVLLDR